MRLMAEPLAALRAGTDVSVDFASWMLSEQRRVYSLCRRLLQDQDEADCATQDVFLKAYQALQKEDAKALEDPARWLTRIAVNTCLDRLRDGSQIGESRQAIGLGPPVVIDQQIARQARQPDRERSRGGAEACQRFEHAQENLLRKVLGVGVRSGEAVTDGVHAPRVHPDQIFPGGSVAGEALFDELSIGLRCRESRGRRPAGTRPCWVKSPCRAK